MDKAEQRLQMEAMGYRYDIARRWYVHKNWEAGEMPDYLPPAPWGFTEQQVYEAAG